MPDDGSGQKRIIERRIYVRGAKKKRYHIQILLFIMTIFTTLIAGASFYASGIEMFKDPSLILKGIPFSFSLIAILLAHEMGHYITSRIYRVDVTLPYFIPAPTIFGTLGAVIKMRSPLRKKTVLLDIGAAGPIAGVIVAIPIVIWGLAHSEIVSLAKVDGTYFLFGDSILFNLISHFTVGDVPEGKDLMLHPVAFAGWVGFLVTALNLMPMGQLDGGHIAYALFGARQRFVSRAFLVLLLILGVIYYQGWLIWAILILIIGVDHPPIVDDEVPLDVKRKVVGFIAFAVFILTFIPVPVKIDF